MAGEHSNSICAVRRDGSGHRDIGGDQIVLEQAPRLDPGDLVMGGGLERPGVPGDEQGDQFKLAEIPAAAQARGLGADDGFDP